MSPSLSSVIILFFLSGLTNWRNSCSIYYRVLNCLTSNCPHMKWLHINMLSYSFPYYFTSYNLLFTSCKFIFWVAFSRVLCIFHRAKFSSKHFTTVFATRKGIHKNSTQLNNVWNNEMSKHENTWTYIT